MPTITFLPDNKSCEIDVGVSLVAAAEKAGVMLPLPCAGKGQCGKCLIQVKKGSVDFDNNGKLSQELLDKGYVLSCLSSVGRMDAEIRILSDLAREKGSFADSVATSSNIEKALFPTADQISPLTRWAEIHVALPEMLDGLGDYDRFKNAVTAQLSLADIELPLSLLRLLPDLLRTNGGEITVWYHEKNGIAQIVDILASKSLGDFGLAVDIGTTTVAVQLVDMSDGRIIAVKTGYNAQIERGMDVISRISYAKTPAKVEEMRALVVGTVNRIIEGLCADNGIDARYIRNLTFAANTTMTELFYGITPDYIRLDPYTPALFGVPLYRAGALGVLVNPNAFVYFAPNVGSYVGGDITAGMLCTDFAIESESLALFIDIGTNGEIVLGNNDFLMGCACSAGPAFEGGGIEKGMRASDGAIDKVTVDPKTGRCEYSVIGGGPAKGICGSGLIALAAQLFERGIIDQRGKFNQEAGFETISDEKRPRYYIVPPEDDDEGIFLTETDIDNLIRSKAAIFSACLTMLNSVGLEFDSIEKLYIAGGFGRFIDIDSAKTIGLLPNIDNEKFIYIGNSSLTGSYMALISKAHRDKIAALASKITYVDLSNEPAYMDEYVSAMFLPHTNEKLFKK